MQQLPLCHRVVFVDWHGVLSRAPFWTSIRESAAHPLHEQLEAGMAGVFANQSAIANEWMLGLLSSEQVIEAMGIRLDGRFREDFLARRLDVDCKKMPVNVELFEVLRKIKSHACVVLATDNMDCFQRTFDQARSRSRRWKPESETLADWAVICDDIICSSEVGALKAENPIGFFGGWLANHGMQFQDAALIDDRADNCAAFAAQGGTPIRYKMTVNDVTEVIGSLNGWLAPAA
jgi:FMN phosphatase YigB (HAD superfamily)